MNMIGHAFHDEEIPKSIDNIGRVEFSFCLSTKTFPAVLIDYRQPSKSPAAMGVPDDRVIGPDTESKSRDQLVGTNHLMTSFLLLEKGALMVNQNLNYIGKG